jgi:hypothetical protein
VTVYSSRFKPIPFHTTLEVQPECGKKCTLTVTCVIACEVNTPEGVKPLEWRLLINRTVETPGQAMEIIDWWKPCN